MSAPRYAIGIDFGTSSVRALIVETGDGTETATATFDFPRGDLGVIGDPRDPNLARQNPRDYVEGLRAVIPEVVRLAGREPGFSVDRIAGIGVDTTGSTPIPVDASAVPLAFQARFAAEPAAMAWLWKDHTAHGEAAEITDRAAAFPYLGTCGGAYSSEWYWAKILRCERGHPEVARAAAGWVEACDWIPAYLCGIDRVDRIPRSICAAGHKAMYHPSWDGLPSAAFLDSFGAELSRFRRSFRGPALPADRVAGHLAPGVAAAVGLPAGVPVAVGAFDAHLGAVGAGVAPGTLVKIIGTSTCDCAVAPIETPLPNIPGISGIVPESIVPGMYGLEAGQSAVGDIFDWFVRRIGPTGPGGGPLSHSALTEAAARLMPGESGLVALDWHNGNRSVLCDPLLTGLIIGETVQTTPAEIYRALVEATAFGALAIVRRIEEYGVTIDRIVACGGIAEKSPLVMQIYADVTGRPMHLSRSGQSCALGAAIMGAVAGGAHPSVPAAQRAMTGLKPAVHRPDPAAMAVYERLGQVYAALADGFGRGAGADLGWVMKELIAIRQEVRRRR